MYNFTGVSAWARLSFIFSQSPGAVAAFPELPGPTSVVDNIFSRDLRTAPHRACQAFGLRERSVGAPAALFARKAQQKILARGRTAPIRRWRELLLNPEGFGVRGQIAGVNSYINQAAETLSIADYVKSPPWTSPVDLRRCNDGGWSG